MYLRRFLSRLEAGSAGERAEVVGALACMFFQEGFDAEQRNQVLTALTAVLEDPAPRVRRAMAEALADDVNVPAVLLQALCSDTCEVAEPILSRSPALGEAWLVDMCGAGDEGHRVAIARRPSVGVPLAAAIAEIGEVESCLTLLANPGARVARSSLARIVERHRGDARLRNALLARSDLPAMLRHRLVGGLSEALGEMVAAKGWMPAQRTERLVRDMQETATLEITDELDEATAYSLAASIHADGQLSVTLLLRALVRGQRTFFEAAMAELSGVPVRRVTELLAERSGAGLRSIYVKTGLPPEGGDCLWTAYDVLHEMEPLGTRHERLQAGRRIVERVLSRYEAVCGGEVDAFYALLIRLAADEAREEARAQAGGYFEAA